MSAKASDAPVVSNDRTSESTNFDMPDPIGLQGARDDAFGVGAMGLASLDGNQANSLESNAASDGIGTQMLDDVQSTVLDAGDNVAATGSKILDSGARHITEVPNDLASMNKDYGIEKGDAAEGQKEAADKNQLDLREGVALFALDAASKGPSDAAKAKVDAAFENAINGGEGLNYNQKLYEGNPASNNPHYVFDENSWGVQKNTA